MRQLKTANGSRTSLFNLAGLRLKARREHRCPVRNKSRLLHGHIAHETNTRSRGPVSLCPGTRRNAPCPFFQFGGKSPQLPPASSASSAPAGSTTIIEDFDRTIGAAQVATCAPVSHATFSLCDDTEASSRLLNDAAVRMAAR